jgi:predicted acyl esterase
LSLQPTSYLFKKGQCVRVSIAGSNPRDFLPLNLGEGVNEYTLNLHVKGCRIWLPSVR